jgi:Skp family chaperone for outer membrane proteins
MGSQLDLDDVAATSPLAMQELAQLRAEVERQEKVKFEYVELYKAEQSAVAKLRAEVEALREALERISNMDSMSYHSLESAKIVARKALAPTASKETSHD